MRFMIMVKGNKDYEAGLPPTPELIGAIGKLSSEMTAAGVLLGTGGLLPSSKGARVRAKGGKLLVTDGPFAETKELVGGYAIVEAKSKDEAVDIARRFMELHRIHWPEFECEGEVRGIQELS